MLIREGVETMYRSGVIRFIVEKLYAVVHLVIRSVIVSVGCGAARFDDGRRRAATIRAGPGSNADGCTLMQSVRKPLIVRKSDPVTLLSPLRHALAEKSQFFRTVLLSVRGLALWQLVSRATTAPT